jgi:hypothetical protein
MKPEWMYNLFMRKFVLKKFKLNHTLYGNKILEAEEGGKIIKEYLAKEEPCMIGRIGTVEMWAINSAINVEQGLFKTIPAERIQSLYNNAGFFPKEQVAVENFVSIYRDACTDLDVAAVMGGSGEDYFLHNYAPNLRQYVTLMALEPYYNQSPWSSVLEGKRVLVVHPFSETIEAQYKKHKSLFENPQVLPDFTLLTVKAVQTIGDNTAGFVSWFDALQYMKDEISQRDFDIAILGCGAYAFPLASHIKRIGRKAIIMGGATQILFGIKGKRWDNHPISSFYNDDWVRPKESERPEAAKNVENGCYW